MCIVGCIPSWIVGPVGLIGLSTFFTQPREAPQLLFVLNGRI
jgi:hypothetical protein